MKQTCAFILLLSLCISLLTACVYQQPIQQGNILTDQQIQQLHTGMTLNAVRRILGDPLLTNHFQDNRLIYIYTLRKNHQPMAVRRVTVEFAGNKVIHIDVFKTHR